jgi:adenosylcobinamide amidohydrolase
MSQATVPAAAAAYFGISTSPARDDFPIVTAEFRPGRGWVRAGYHKRVSGAWCRKLRAEGVEFVELTLGCRRADFSIAELARAPRRVEA